MSYIPPHLRISQGQSKPPSPPPPRGPRTSRELVPYFKRSVDYVSKIIILVGCRHLHFAKYQGDTFPHLQHDQLYVLEPSSQGEDAIETSLQEPLATRCIEEAVNDRLKEILVKFKRIACIDGVRVPLMWMKFGKMIFTSRNDSVETWHKVYTPQEVLALTNFGKVLFKTFDNSVSKEKFSLLHDIAHKNASQSWSTERFIVQVSDKSRPDRGLWCVCACSEGDEQSRLVSKTSTLTMLKVRLCPVRVMISDVACVGKSSDIRLMFLVKEYLTGLSDAEVQDLQSCLGKACVDDTVKGGLNWPSKKSASGRFKVIDNVHVIKTIVVGAGLMWSFLECNRVDFLRAWGRISYEVAVRPLVYNAFCKGRGEHTIEEVMCSIADAIQQVWEGCIES